MTPVYKQKKVENSFVPTLMSLEAPEQALYKRINDLTFHGPNSQDLSVRIINDGTIRHYDTVFKTFVVFENKEHPTKTGVSLYWIPKGTTEGTGIWVKLPCTSETGSECNKGLETMIEDLLVLLCVHRLIHISHLPGMTLNTEYALRNLLSEVYNPARIMKKATRKFYEIKGKV